MDIYATTNFRTKLFELGNKKYSRFYSCILTKLKKKLNDFQKSGVSGDRIFHAEGVICYKARTSSCTTNGSSYGFRLIVVESKSSDTIYLIDIYPKYGPLSDNGRVNVDSKKAMTLLEETYIEKQSNLLLKVTIEKSSLEFEEIIPENIEQSYVSQEEE